MPTPPKPKRPTPVSPPVQCPAPQPPKETCPPPRPKVHNKKEPETLPGFFKHLLPKELETADLLIILLILLMAGDCEEDRNNALLTLALYFFL